MNETVRTPGSEFLEKVKQIVVVVSENNPRVKLLKQTHPDRVLYELTPDRLLDSIPNDDRPTVHAFFAHCGELPEFVFVVNDPDDPKVAEHVYREAALGMMDNIRNR